MLGLNKIKGIIMAKKKEQEIKIINEVKLSFSQLLGLYEKIEEYNHYDEHSLNDDESYIKLSLKDGNLKAEIHAEFVAYQNDELFL